MNRYPWEYKNNSTKNEQTLNACPVLYLKNKVGSKTPGEKNSMLLKQNNKKKWIKLKRTLKTKTNTNFVSFTPMGT